MLKGVGHIITMQTKESETLKKDRGSLFGRYVCGCFGGRPAHKECVETSRAAEGWSSCDMVCCGEGIAASVCSTGRPAASIRMPVPCSACQLHFAGHRLIMMLLATFSARKLQGSFAGGPGLDRQTLCWLIELMQFGSSLSVSLLPGACQTLTACTGAAQQHDLCWRSCPAALSSTVEVS